MRDDIYIMVDSAYQIQREDLLDQVWNEMVDVT